MPKHIFATTALIAGFAALARPAAAKEFGKLMPPDQSFELLLDTVPAPGDKDDGIVLNKLVSLTVTIHPLTDAAKTLKYTDFKLDAKMTAHKHGMVTKPKITAVGPLEYRVDGIKLHMAGDWEVFMGLKAGELPVFWTVPYTVK